LDKPSPKIKASTAVCLVSPRRSANGVMMGMETRACPDAEGMKKLSND
jgi:hypothetical protein